MKKYCYNCMREKTSGEKCEYCKEEEKSNYVYHIPVGTILNHRYMIGKAIGEGGFGITYIARDLNLDMIIAVKEYYPNGYANRNNEASLNITITGKKNKEFFESGKVKFIQEARVLAKFSGNKNIVDVRDYFEENNTAYIVMEYIEGITLSSYLKRNGKIEAEEIFEKIIPLCEALKKVHKNGLIHRDVSPDNIMILENGTLKLMDFGAARSVNYEDQKSLSIMLKPGYAPEEQYRSKGIQGPWTDIYALCATIYKCITGETPDQSMNRVFSDELKRPSELGIEISVQQEEALMKGMAVYKKDRYQSIDEFIKEIKEKTSEEIYSININMSENKEDKTELYQDDEEKTEYYEEEKTESYDEAEDVTEAYVDEEKTEIHSDVDDITESYEDDDKTSIFEENEDNNEEIPIYKKPVEKNISNKDRGTAVSNQNSRVKKEKKKGKFVKIFLIASLLVIGIIVITVVFNSLNKKNIAGEQVDSDATSLYFNGNSFTEKDIDLLLSCGKLERLTFHSCIFEEDSFKGIGEISSTLKSISLISCNGIKDYNPVSKLKYLTELSINNCSLTNKQLSDISFEDNKYLTKVELSNNTDIDDLTPLNRISDSLTSIIVDNTSVSDFSPLKKCENLLSVYASHCRLTSLSTLDNKNLSMLHVDDNEINDISMVADYEYLMELSANNNKISDISSLANHKMLTYIKLNNNKIADLSSISDLENIICLQVSHNQIDSLLPLKNFKKLRTLYVSSNKLTSLDGLQTVLELNNLQAADNRIETLDGIENCTVLDYINLNNNKNISDISVLAKSKGTLKKAYLADNKISDISCLNNMPLMELLNVEINNISDISPLKYNKSLVFLNLDNNNVSSISDLSELSELITFTAENNCIESLSGIGDWTKIRYINVPDNKISDVTSLKKLIANVENDINVVNICNNKITDIEISNERKINYLSIYNNPLKGLDWLENAKGQYLLFSYIDGEDYTALGKNFNFYKVIDCPLDKQVNLKKDLNTGMIEFQTVKEADEATEEQKNFILNGFRTPEEVDAENKANEENRSGNDSTNS